MSKDDPIDDLSESVSDGKPVDWNLAESGTEDAGHQASVRALRDLERIGTFNWSLQPSPGQDQTAPPDTKPPEQWGHLTLLELISAGKSGEIWRAWDASLRREVALKFLLMPSGGDADDSALLEEARALARVRHPGVVAVHGIGANAGRVGMWMELLDGGTLDAEIERRGALPSDDVALIGLELCRALEAVGAAGLVHRDIKPANIVRDSTGRIVLTDFGLGRRRVLAVRETWRSSGTPIFMSPELLAGEPATPRSDLYALGVTLRWALTGHCPFRARTFEELKAEAETGPSEPLRAERPDAPTILINAIERAMAPRGEARYAEVSQLAKDLQQVLDDSSATAGRRFKWRGIAYATAAILLVGAAALFLSSFAGQSASPRLVRFSVTAPANTRLFSSPEAMAVSPDGRWLVFAVKDSAGTTRLWLRPLASLAAKALEGTEYANQPFWSPDSRHVGFFADSKLKKISIAGGPPEILAQAPDMRGASWGKGGVIVFAPNAAGPLCRVSSEGGVVTEIQRPDSVRQETSLRWPQFLPDGKHFLFVALPPRDGSFDVFAASPDSKGRRHVMRAGCAPICAGKQGVILASNGRLMLQKFDYRRLRPVGAPVALGTAPISDVSVGQPLASASMNGVLAQLNQSLTNTQLVWRDRSGRRTGLLSLPEGRYENLYFAPDGNRLLAERRDSPTMVDLWMIELPLGEARRFTYGSQSRIGGQPTWSPDGNRIAFSSNREGKTNIYQRLADEAGEEELLFRSNGQFKEVNCWSPDGRYLVFEQADPVTGWDLWLLPMEGKREPIPYLRTRFKEAAASVSPDGRWLAYSTDATGRVEVYVRSFPKPGVEHLVSHAPGRAVWSKGGRELLVLHSRDDQIWSVPISTTPTFRAGTPRALFREPAGVVWLTPTPAGDRFLESSPVGKIEPPTITVDLNFAGRAEP